MCIRDRGYDSEIIYIKRTAAVAGDRDALGAAIDSAKALIDAGLIDAGYDAQTSFNLVAAYEKALAVSENEGESAQAVNAAVEQLKNAQAALKKGSAGSKAEVENIIGSIGGIKMCIRDSPLYRGRSRPNCHKLSLRRRAEPGYRQCRNQRKGCGQRCKGH